MAGSSDGEFPGKFGLAVHDDDPTAPGLGYRLRRRFWGQGLATEGPVPSSHSRPVGRPSLTPTAQLDW